MTNAPSENLDSILANIATSSTQADVLASMPLKDCESFVAALKRRELGEVEVDGRLAFDVSNHEAAQTVPALDVLNRFKEDVQAYASFANETPLLKFIGLSDDVINRFFAGDVTAEASLSQALASARQLMVKLQQMRDSDAKMVLT